MVCFGEVVRWKTRGLQAKLAERWPLGVWVGKTTIDDEHIVLTPEGVRTSRAVQRLPEDERPCAEDDEEEAEERDPVEDERKRVKGRRKEELVNGWRL